jgi:beta-xylosidase
VSYAGHPIKGPDGKYYFYTSTNWCGIGVSVSDRPEGPYKDVLGKPLLTKDDCKGATHSWVCIDPVVFIDDDGQPYIFWGNKQCYYAKLKKNMIEIDGEIHPVNLKDFTEAPYMHKHNGKYYLTYAAQWPEKIAYAMSDSITGPWEYKGIISEIAGNSNTTHPAIVDFKGRSYFFSHIGGLGGGSGSRSVIAEPLYYNADGTIRKIPASAAGASVEYSALDNYHNPILPDLHADPEILYSNKTGKYYIYSTTDGTPGWGGHYFTVFSSPNLTDWTSEGIMLDVKSSQVPWANGNAWAPAIIERKEGNGYKYYFYFSAHSPAANKKQIGVAVADDPAGPFFEIGHPIVKESPAGRGQQIDVDVFQDPVSGKYYLYWGNGYMAGAELNDDLLSIKEETVKVMTPKGGTLQTYAYREAPYVFYRNGIYYFLWSVDDTGSPNYHVAYGTSDSPLGDIKVADPCNILMQNPEKEIYGTAHNSVINIPGTDEWRIVYHRINKNFIEKDKKPGIHREVCIDRMEFNPDGTIKPVTPTL